MSEERKVFTVAPTALTLELRRVPADATHEVDQLELGLWRGEFLGTVEIERGEIVDDTLFEGVSENERLQMTGLVAAEWLAWPDTVNHLDESVLGTKRDAIDHLEAALAVAKRGLNEPRDPLFGGLS